MALTYTPELGFNDAVYSNCMFYALVFSTPHLHLCETNYSNTKCIVNLRYIYDSGYLTCSKKLTGSQLSLPHGRLNGCMDVIVLQYPPSYFSCCSIRHNLS